MSIDIFTYEPRGDKKHSDYFHENRLRVYERRRDSGLAQLIGAMRAIVIQIQTGDGPAYLEELHMMSPYQYQRAYINKTHKIYILESRPEYPRLIVLEPLSKSYVDTMTRLNALFPNGRKAPNARYVGEIYHTTNLEETRKIQESQDIRFYDPGDTLNPFYTNPNLEFTWVSNYTGNRLGYIEKELDDYDTLELGDRLIINPDFVDRLKKMKDRAERLGFDQLMLGVDHMATRMLAGEREDAILEFLSLTNYHFWGAYNITDQNSSTNVTRYDGVDDEKLSPAKVFTANNTPSFLNSFEKRPMPTENFVINYGRRMHHIAYEVIDGDHTTGQKNIDYVVGELEALGVDFLDTVVGECKDKPDLKQIFSRHSRYSILITEYVQRCFGYDGFFSKSNVAALTKAAGEDERYEQASERVSVVP